MNKIIQILSILFVFSIPFFDVPKTPIDGIAISGFISLIIGFLLLIRFQLKDIFMNKKMLISYFCYIIWMVFSLFYQQDYNSKSINHLILYIYSFYTYGLVSYWVFYILGIKKFQKVLISALYIVFIIGIIEFSLYYLKGFEAYASFLNHGRNVGVFSNIPRMRSTFNEPSHLSLFLITIFPIIYDSRDKKAILISGLMIIMSFSTSAVFGLTMAYIMLKILNLLFDRKKKYIGLRKILTYIVIFFIMYLFKDVLVSFKDVVIRKVFYTSETDITRISSWNLSWNLVKEAPIMGYGMAAYYKYLDYGVFNWYLQIWLELGIIGLILLLFFLLIPILQLDYKEYKLYYYFYIAFLIQMFVLNHYYIPGIWILISYIYFVKVQNKNMKNE